MLADLLTQNHLEGSALLLVRNNNDIDDIWIRLKEVFGDVRTLLCNKISELNDIDQLAKQREPVKLVESLSKLINLMKDLMQLAKRHDIETKLLSLRWY